jgi:hypothetical protein
MKPLTRSAAVMALLVLLASSTFAASNDRHRARSHDGATAGTYGYEGAPRARSIPEVSRRGADLPAWHLSGDRPRCARPRGDRA